MSENFLKGPWHFFNPFKNIATQLDATFFFYLIILLPLYYVISIVSFSLSVNK